MTDRDTFAAAALTGLLYPDVDDEFAMSYIVGRAYLWADAMLRERERTFDAKPRELSDDQRTLRNAADLLGPGGFKNLANELLSLSRRLKNHDAAPAATADAESDRTDKAAPRSSEGTGDTPMPKEKLAHVSDREPVAWATFYPNGSTASVYIGRQPPHAEPLYRHQQPTLTDEEREAVETAAMEADAHQHTHRAATLRGLLERLA